ncbi:MAG TPA: universal stress protein [Phycisphaerales bacterium]|nr:universal stress protein [Phycisphaerales bacterium]
MPTPPSGLPTLACPPIKVILVPTAFSDLSRHAARYARAVAPAFNARIIVVHAVEPPPPAVEAIAMVPSATLGTDMVALMESARQGVDLFIRENLSGVEVGSVVTVGPPDHEIVQIARREGVDLIVMGTHARGVLNRLVFGSISKSVVESSPCPVLLVPLHPAQTQPEPSGRSGFGNAPLAPA